MLWMRRLFFCWRYRCIDRSELHDGAICWTCRHCARRIAAPIILNYEDVEDGELVPDQLSVPGAKQ